MFVFLSVVYFVCSVSIVICFFFSNKIINICYCCCWSYEGGRGGGVWVGWGVPWKGPGPGLDSV